MRVLVTAGNTREAIDSVRDWGNVFTGNTGLAIARALADVAEVDLLTSNRQHLTDLAAASPGKRPIRATSFTSHEDLLNALDAIVPQARYDAIFMTAAVADYKPAGTFVVSAREHLPDGTERWTVRDVQAGKVKSTHPQIAVLGNPTAKLVDLFRTRWDYRGLLFKFKLEVGLSADDLLKVADASRKASDADYLVANTLDMTPGRGPAPGAYLLSHGAPPEWVPRDQLPMRLRELVVRNVKRADMKT